MKDVDHRGLQRECQGLMVHPRGSTANVPLDQVGFGTDSPALRGEFIEKSEMDDKSGEKRNGITRAKKKRKEGFQCIMLL